VWSRDGRSVAFQSEREGDAAIFLQNFDGTGSARRLTMPEGKQAHVPEDRSPTQDVLAFSVINGQRSELWMWSQSDGKTSRFGTIESVAPFDAVFSPDGRWFA
jgi:Tol biopolymer transport system component